MITTKSGFKNALQESERDAFGNYTWRQAMSNIDYQTKLAEAQAKQLYGEDVATAYQAATQQRAMIGASALGSGSKTLLQQELDDTLSTAYDKYMSNYQSNLASVEAQATKAYSELGKTLEERAANMQTFESEHYKYLQYLDKWRQENAVTEDELKDFFDLTAWGNYYKEVPVYDAEGNIISTNRDLKAWEDLTTPVRDEVTGEYLSFYDNEGNLTRAGRDFYTKIENYYGQKAIKEGETAIPSFASYLYQANPELYNWANEYNPYSYTPTSTGLSQNIGEFRQLMGIRSDADEYRFIEYYGGLSKKQIDDVFNDIYSKLNTDSVTIDNAVDGNVFVMAQKVTIGSKAYIYSDLFVLGNEVSINGYVYDLYACANKLDLTSSAYIIRDISASAKTVNLAGFIRRNANLSFDTINVDEDTAVIKGNLNYTSSSKSVP